MPWRSHCYGTGGAQEVQSLLGVAAVDVERWGNAGERGIVQVFVGPAGRARQDGPLRGARGRFSPANVGLRQGRAGQQEHGPAALRRRSAADLDARREELEVEISGKGGHLPGKTPT